MVREWIPLLLSFLLGVVACAGWVALGRKNKERDRAGEEWAGFKGLN